MNTGNGNGGKLSEFSIVADLIRKIFSFFQLIGVSGMVLNVCSILQKIMIIKVQPREIIF
jgi:hypothetical protein